MTLEELFQKLSYGPLSNLALSNEGAGGITEEKQPAIVHYANEALLRLHTRFILIERSLILKQVDGISFYEITPKNTYSASVSADRPAAIPYIQDSLARPFQDDLIKILRVFDACGCEVKLNDEKYPGCYFTPQNHILQIPCPVNDELTQVAYQARHPKLDLLSGNVKQVITIPPSLEEALLSYISYLQYSNMNGQEHLARSSELLNRYEMICSENELRGVVNTNENTTNTKLEQRGFV